MIGATCALCCWWPLGLFDSSKLLLLLQLNGVLQLQEMQKLCAEGTGMYRV